MAEKIIEVAAAVIIRDGRCLITQRLETSPHGGLWEFPGGKRHPDETLEDCLRRELKEELDITAGVDGEIKVIRHAYTAYTVRLHFYRCTIIGGTPRALGNQAYRWVPLSELSQFEFPEANRSLIRDLQNPDSALGG
ncbi:MAG TPA: (deoxy)nucleoside triphosphate pyrophosphohydrolase [Nitrospiria bacterium]|nr:(deoxy)nucleoside triphosphate pyrophosphohydrolase [Nitrospiria bacterium]